ncbi:MAG: ATP synthase F1 subunit delta [Pirellulales bacterium]|nr:ATP synthase F1 subunit delta [Pirellulales bacterium]
MTEFQNTAERDARTAAQIEADVGVERIADVYAKALLGAARHAGQLAAVVAEFDHLLAVVFDKFPKLETLLTSALVSVREKYGVIDRTLGGRASALMVGFLKIVARHGRLDCLRAIHHQTHVMYDKMRKRIRVELTTATPVDAAEVRRIVDGLREKLDGEPVLQQRIDPELIGGAVIRVGDVVYDGSIANQLKQLRQRMSQRSANEIQGRRDRFRHTAGN